LNAGPPMTALEYFKGIFKDEPAFDEVVEYGRQFRQGTLPEGMAP